MAALDTLPRDYCAYRLLVHGALTVSQAREITGWGDETEPILADLAKRGLISRSQDKRGQAPFYYLPEDT